jgi:hypothetical protein
MAKSKDTVETDMIGTSLRLTVAQAGWVQNRAKKLGSFNTVVRLLIDDARHFYGLPDVLKEQLEKEAHSLGKDPREYVIHTLTLHAVELLNRAKGKSATDYKK